MIYNVHALHTFNKSWHLKEIFQCYIMYVHYIQSECLLSSLLSDLISIMHTYVNTYAYVSLCVCITAVYVVYTPAYTVLLQFTKAQVSRDAGVMSIY